MKIATEKQTESLNLMEKLAEIRKAMKVFQKKLQGHNYTYTDLNEILGALHTQMNKHNLLLIPQVQSQTAKAVLVQFEKGKTLKKSQEEIDYVLEPQREYLVQADMVYIWFDVPSGQRLEVPWFVSGSQVDPSQAFGSATTYGIRQFLTQFFQIATPEDDPDKWRSRQRSDELKAEQALADDIVSEIDGFVTGYIGRHSDSAQKIKKLISKYADGGNYFAIKDPIVAGRLLQELTNTFKED